MKISKKRIGILMSLSLEELVRLSLSEDDICDCIGSCDCSSGFLEVSSGESFSSNEVACFLLMMSEKIINNESIKSKAKLY